MSGITATSLLVPRPILSALPQSAEKGIEGQGQVDPAAPTPPIETPPPQINQGTIVAIIEFAGGAVAAITAEEIEREIQSPEQLNRTDLIQLRYKLFTEKIGKLKEGKTVTAFEILDPDMKFLYALNVLLSQDLGEEMLAKFEAQLLPVKTPDKPYLIMLFAFILYGNGKIKIEKAEELVKKAVASGPELTEIYFNAYRFFAAANKFDQAYYYLINGLRAGCKLPLDKNPAPKNALVDFGLLSECVPMEMLLEVPAFLLLESEFDLQNKKYDSALGWIEITIKITGKTPFPNEKQKAIFFADLELKKAKILMAQEEYMDAYKSLESAVKVYDEAAEKNPENAGLQLRLASIFLALLQINKFLPGYQPYLRYHLGRCIPSMKAALKSAEKTAKEDVSMLFDISQLYVSMGETADAIRIMEKLVSLAPKNTQYAMQLGDLYLSGGDIDKAFENYEKALAIAGEDPMLTANLHIRFAFIQTQAETNLVRIRAGKPNIAQSLLNFGVTALLTYFNPSYLLSQTIGKLTGAIFNKKYSEEEWDKINKKAVDLESRSFYRTAELIKQQNRPDVFFYIVEAVFTQSASLLKQASEMKEKSVTNPEEIEGIKEIAAALKQQAGYIIEGTFKKSFIKKLGTDFEKAKAAKSTEEMLKIVSLYFDLFFFITDKIGDKNAPPALVDALELVRGMVFEEGIKRIGEIRTLAEDTLDLNLGMDLFQLSSRIMDALVKKKEGSKDRKIKRAEEAVREEVLETLAVNIKVATANRNLPALMEFGKAIRFFGPFSYKAWEEALKLAEGNREKLVEIGGILVSLWEEESQDLVQELGNKESLKKLATITYQKIRDLSSGEERLVACRQLWVLGDYESAYLGYVATIDEFKAQKDPAKLANLFYELAHISEARGNHEKAVEWMGRAVKEGTSEQKTAFKDELEILKSGVLPDFLLIKSETRFPAMQIRSAILLAVSWTRTAPSLKHLERAIEDLYLANNLRATASVKANEEKLEVEIKEEKIDAIKITVSKKGKQKTKTEVILRELGYAGLNPGDPLPADLSTLSGRISEASNRLKTFVIKDFKFVEKDGERTLVVEIDEPYSGALTIRGGGGKDQFLFGLGGKYLNLFGGGEKIGGMLTTHFFFPAGHKFMYNIGGNIFYEDPHLFVFGKDHPVSGRFEAERASRVNYIDGSLETIMGASITLGVKIAPKTTLLVSPSFYYTAPESGNYEIFQPGLKVALEVDGRDNWLLPKSGYYFLTSVSGGAYFGSTTNAENQKEKFSQFFFANNNEGRFYVQLPVGMVLAFRGVVGFGVNLFGGDIYNTAGPLNPYVRASSNPYAMGPGIVAGSMELRAPVIEIPNSKGTKLQFYGFGDAGYVFNGGVAYGAGVGVRMYIPLLGVINIGWGGPGNWPLGFFFWAGDQGWN